MRYRSLSSVSPWRVVPPASCGAPRCPRSTRVRALLDSGFAYRALTLYGGASQLPSALPCLKAGFGSHPRTPHNPHPATAAALAPDRFGLVPVRSPLLRDSRLFPLPPGTKMFQFPGFPCPASRPGMTRSSRAGFPHSDIPGSMPASGSPGLFAAGHVLRRLSAPRHPPCALSPVFAVQLSMSSDLVEMSGFEPPTPGLQNRCSPAELHPQSPGGHRWTRTTDLTLIRRALSPLSYTPISRPRPLKTEQQSSPPSRRVRSLERR